MRAVRWPAGVLLTAVTFVFLASLGGGMLFAWPVLVPLHWVMARDSGPVDAGWWAFLAAMSMLEVGWMLAYIVSRNVPSSFVFGLMSFIATGAGFLVARSRRVATE